MRIVAIGAVGEPNHTRAASSSAQLAKPPAKNAAGASAKIAFQPTPNTTPSAASNAATNTARGSAGSSRAAINRVVKLITHQTINATKAPRTKSAAHPLGTANGWFAAAHADAERNCHPHHAMLAVAVAAPLAHLGIAIAHNATPASRCGQICSHGRLCGAFCGYR